MKEELEHLGIRLPKSLIGKIDLLQKIHIDRTGFHLSKTSIIRTLLEEALKNRESQKTK